MSYKILLLRELGRPNDTKAGTSLVYFERLLQHRLEENGEGPAPSGADTCCADFAAANALGKACGCGVAA